MTRFLLPPRGARPAPAAPQPVETAAAAMPATAAPRLLPRFRPAPAANPVVKSAAAQPAPQPQPQPPRVMAKPVAELPPPPPTAAELREEQIRLAEFLLVVEAAEDPARRDSVAVTWADAQYFGLTPVRLWETEESRKEPADWRVVLWKSRDGRRFIYRPLHLRDVPEDIVAEARHRATTPRSQIADPASTIASAPAELPTPAMSVQLASSDEVDLDYDAAVTTLEAPDPYDDEHEVREPEDLVAATAAVKANHTRPKRNFERPDDGAQG